MRTAVLLLSTVTVALAATCGQTPVAPNLEGQNNKILGGTIAVPYSWPWQVVWCRKSFLDNKICLVECGGTIIAPGWVMTAGHCIIDDLNPRNYKVKAGIFLDIQSSDEDAEQVVNVKAIHIHPKFDASTIKYDIALIELATPLTYGDHVQPVCLPSSDDTAISYPNMLWATGWGSIEEAGMISFRLRQVDMPIVDLPTCGTEYIVDHMEVHEEIEFCAGDHGVDACQVDGGGPLVQQTANGTWFQYGIDSWGHGCGRGVYADVFVRVSAFCDFIDNTTSGAAKCQTPA